MNKPPRTHCEIDLRAIRSNVIKIKSALAPNAKLMCVVKANAYSHGAVEVAKCCGDLADFFGVATPKEGARLRKSGISLPILVLGATVESDFGLLLRYGLQATVYSLDSAKALNDYAAARGARAKVHMAVDTGMGRIGFLPSEKEQALQVLSFKGLQLEGVFTHFACADCSDGTYTKMQAERFDEFVTYLRANGANIPLVHADNSGGVLSGGHGGDMARCGIIVYGLYPSEEVQRSVALEPALSWRTLVTHIKELPKGSRISYGGEYVAKKVIKIATIPVGYADGYPRILSGRACALVCGRRAPIVGRICMDQMMLDVTDIEGVRLRDEVALLGCQGEESIRAEELAALAGTVNYELLCGISERVKRVYIRADGRQVKRD